MQSHTNIVRRILHGGMSTLSTDLATHEPRFGDVLLVVRYSDAVTDAENTQQIQVAEVL